MKRLDLFCSSPSPTAICSSLDHRSMVRRGTTPIHGHKSKPYVSSSQLPINTNHSSSSSSSSAKQTDFDRKSCADNTSREIISAANYKPSEFRRKSSADITDLDGSSRHLLSDKIPYTDWISESDHASAFIIHPAHQHSKPTHTPARKSSSSSLVHTQTSKPTHSVSNNSPALRSSSSARSRDQVVVLWVSIHCKGCEGKLRKHISKMEGVTSFNIDLATKKVTVIGNVTPLGVLASVSKVKNAQLWPYQTASTPSPSPRWST